MQIFRLRDEKKDHYWEEELGKCTAIIKGRMMKKGSMMISYQPLGRIPNFFRSIISNQVSLGPYQFNKRNINMNKLYLRKIFLNHLVFKLSRHGSQTRTFLKLFS